MSKEILAVVAGTEITEADLETFLENVPPEVILITCVVKSKSMTCRHVNGS
ncbi:MAG: hypothetical protein ACI39W_04575 [Brotaphodocola sp.]